MNDAALEFLSQIPSSPLQSRQRGHGMRRLYLKDMQPGDVVEEVFVLSNKQLGATAQGKPYIKAIVGDRTCTMMARMWNASKEIFNALPDAGFVKVRGRVENYQ